MNVNAPDISGLTCFIEEENYCFHKSTVLISILYIHSSTLSNIESCTNAST